MASIPPVAPAAQDREAGPQAAHVRSSVKINAILNRIVYEVAKHWLFIFTAAISLYAALPVLAPVLMAAGHPAMASLIYAVFALMCHQLPERSFFLFGPKVTYTLVELERMLGPSVPLRFVGNPGLGYKVAVCERDVAVYFAMLLGGFLFVPLRRLVRPLPVRGFVLMCVPMVIDGFGQLLALWESTWWSRTATGALFGLACVWLAYPYIEAGMRDVLRVVERQPKQ